MSEANKVIQQARSWIQTEPEQRYVEELNALIDTGDIAALEELFGTRISFGTAGLRAQVGPGPAAMNAQVVRQASVGVYNWIKKYENKSTPLIVIGYDGRRDSKDFAKHAAAAYISQGAKVLLSQTHVATPIVAAAALKENADAAAVITASHNPKDDNGYKLYMSNGIQLVSPVDNQIETEIEQALAQWPEYDKDIDATYTKTDQQELAPSQDWTQHHRKGALETLQQLNTHTDTDTAASRRKDITVAYSAMHGVGGEAVVALLEEAGFHTPKLVQAQFAADPEFPTVPFPNPEEKGAIDLAIELGKEVQADVVLANDPDADRLAIAIKNRDGSDYVMLNGNELGVLLADYVLCATGDISERVVARSVVSSRMLDHMAAAHGVESVVSLTGFKWVARPMAEKPGKYYAFGYEEAIGYCIGNKVRDKDGITAALIAAETIAALKSESKTVWDRFDELAAIHGVFESDQIVLRFDNSDVLADVIEQVSTTKPETLGDSKVAAIGPLGLGTLPESSGIHIVTEDNSQIIIRPSGTEPKIKAYLEVIEPCQSTDVEQVRATALKRLAKIRQGVQELLG